MWRFIQNFDKLFNLEANRPEPQQQLFFLRLIQAIAAIANESAEANHDHTQGHHPVKTDEENLLPVFIPMFPGHPDCGPDRLVQPPFQRLCELGVEVLLELGYRSNAQNCLHSCSSNTVPANVSGIVLSRRWNPKIPPQPRQPATQLCHNCSFQGISLRKAARPKGSSCFRLKILHQ